jgi:hypothetical protein
MLLLSEFEKLKKDYADTKEEAEKSGGNSQFIEIFQKLLEDKKNNQNEDFSRVINNLAQKLDKGDNDEQTERLLNEIKSLKAEI